MVTKKSKYVYRVKLGQGVTTIMGKMQWAGRSVLYSDKRDADRESNRRTTKIFTKATGRTQVMKPKVVRVLRSSVAGSHIN